MKRLVGWSVRTAVTAGAWVVVGIPSLAWIALLSGWIRFVRR